MWNVETVRVRVSVRARVRVRSRRPSPPAGYGRGAEERRGRGEKGQRRIELRPPSHPVGRIVELCRLEARTMK